MNGYLSSYAIGNMLSAKVAEIMQLPAGSDFSVGEISDLLDGLKVKMRDLAYLDINDVALEVVREMGTNQKIQSIKEVRTRTGSGLKEAKDAVERAVPRVLKDEAEKILKALEDHNDRVSFGYRVYVQADDFRSINGQAF